jgi:hypothetical protein
MNPPMRRAATVSVVLHVLLLVALIVSLPSRKPDDAQDLTAVSVDFVGPAAPAQQAQQQNTAPAPANTPTVVKAPTATQAPQPTPLVDAPPPPPPPPPPPSETPANQPPVPTPPPPAPTPPQPVTPPTPPQPVTPPLPTPPAPAPPASQPPPPPPSPSAEPLPPPPPPAPPQPQQAPSPAKPVEKPTPPKPAPAKPVPAQAAPAPPAPPAPPSQPPQETAQATPALPMPPPPAPPAPPAPVSPTTQPHPTTNPAAMSQTVLNTLEKLRSMNLDQKAPTARYNPAQGGAPHGGGNPNNSDATASLTSAERGAIGDKVRQCWFIDGGAPNVQSMSVLLKAYTKPDGTVYNAKIVGPDVARYQSDPVFRAFAERAVRALLDYRCSALPLPPSLEGRPQTFTFRFSP